MRKQIKQNQFWTALILAFFALILNSSIALAQQQEKSPSKIAPNDSESSASLEETFSWLKSKLNSLRFGSFNKAKNWESGKKYFETTTGNYETDINTNECSLDIHKTQKYRDSNLFRNLNLKLELSEIDPLSVTVKKLPAGKWSSGEDYEQQVTVYLESSAGNKAIIFKYGFSQPNSYTYHENLINEWSNVFFITETEESANRIAKALKHAIKLCGGKVDPF